MLEKEVETLRTENGWLRGLIVDKTIECASLFLFFSRLTGFDWVSDEGFSDYSAGKDGADNTRKRQREDDEHEAFSSILV